MAFSTITIHMATVDGANFLQDEISTSFKLTLYEYIKQAPFNLPIILFKTGTLSIIFSTLKYGGIAHVIALVLLPMSIGLIVFTEDDVDCVDIMMATLTGLLFH